MQKVHTEKFFLLEAIKEDGGISVLAVSFEVQAIFSFALGLSQEDRGDFLAFRVLEVGGVLNSPNTIKPTHEAPASAV